MEENKRILDGISSPADLKGLSESELRVLSDEIRELLVETVSKTGGHLASNLGVVELTLALHRVMNAPVDHIIFDVGHQSYVHKILTGRRDRFDTLRQGGGLSGFTCRAESEYDCFGAGHSSTSLSAALGFAEADRIKGSDAYTVAVVGDGAYTGGMIHEALNNFDNRLRLILVINENEMSISKNIGRFASNMAKLRANSGYLRTKRATRNFVSRIPLVGKGLFRLMRDTKKLLKNILYGSNYFENLGLHYLGPVDGHDRSAIERLLTEAKQSGHGAVIHVKTVKGRGYRPAETDPGRYHGMSPSNADAQKPNFSAVMGEELTRLADQDGSICAITAAMADGTGLVGFSKAHPDRFYDVGIAEPHALTFAAGLAAQGMKAAVCIYSTFLQRGYDNIIHDIALQSLPVLLCVDRAGLNASDGATHHGVFDVAFLSGIPNLEIYTPLTNETLKASLSAALASGKPSAVRYPNAAEDERVTEAFYRDDDFSLRIARADFDSEYAPTAVIVTDGRIVTEALDAKRRLAEQGVRVGVILLERIKPYGDAARAVASLLPKGVKKIIFLEEEQRAGGMGMMLSDEMRRAGMLENIASSIMAIDDDFVIRRQNEPILKTAGIDAESIVNEIMK